MSVLILGIGMVLCFEGLVFALAPNYLDKMLAILSNLPARDRRMAGLGALAVGVGLIWLAKQMGL